MCMGTSSLYFCLVVQVGNSNVNVLSTVSWSVVILRSTLHGQFDSNCFHHSPPICQLVYQGSDKRQYFLHAFMNAMRPIIWLLLATLIVLVIFIVLVLAILSLVWEIIVASCRCGIRVECAVAGKNGRNKCDWTYWRRSRTVRPPDSSVGLGFTEKVSIFHKFPYTLVLYLTDLFLH
jgi:hypothetical protein